MLRRGYGSVLISVEDEHIGSREFPRAPEPRRENIDGELSCRGDMSLVRNYQWVARDGKQQFRLTGNERDCLS